MSAKSMSAKSICSGSSVDRIKLPKPDVKNITVLTHNLPNSPILPWNHYDNPPSLTPEAIDEATEPPSLTSEATDEATELTVEAADQAKEESAEDLD